LIYNFTNLRTNSQYLLEAKLAEYPYSMTVS